tara:strand:- start:9121 stop:11757 length:2637 start_codon:yes stop_codon:yes gene_type:complete
MSILFFDGFDRCTITKDLDPNYWSYQPGQPLEYEQYAFGGYSYNHNTNNYPDGNFNGYDEGGMGRGNGYYTSYSPNNGILPTGIYRSSLVSGQGSSFSGNGYPGFGAPPGFLALTNLDISDGNALAPITYVQLSGFNIPSGDSTFLTTRILGLETKDTTYATNDKPGRFGSKHPIVAFCSGNITGLILNAVKVTGNHLETLEEEKMTMAIEVEQAEGVSGHFDMNITNDLNNFRVRSVFGTRSTNNSGNMPGRILTTDAEHWDYQFDGTNYNRRSVLCPISRWCHLQFGVVGTGTVPYIQIKLEDVDLLQIPTDDTISNKDNWEDKIYISGFNYDNIRFFNRTYNGGLDWEDVRTISPAYQPHYYVGNDLDNIYYGKGSMTLIDDVILSDDAGSTSTFLGKNAKVVPFTPGASGGNITDNYQKSGLLEWSTNTSSTILALKNLDGDTGKISTSVSGAISAVPYIPYSKNIGTPDMQAFQHLSSIQDAIGGMKIYAQAKKEFLDTRYIPVINTGTADVLSTGVACFLSFEDNTNPFFGRSRNKFEFQKSGEFVTEQARIGSRSFKINSGEFVRNFDTSMTRNLDFNRRNAGNYGSSDFPGAPNPVDFTLEAWVQFSGLNDTITMASKSYRHGSDSIGYFSPNAIITEHSWDLIVSTGALTYKTSKSMPNDGPGHEHYSGVLDLSFPTTGIGDLGWHHIALSRTSTGLIVFLDGQSGTDYGLTIRDKDGNHLDNTYSYGSWGNTTTTAGGRTGNNELFYWEDAYSEVRNFASYATVSAGFGLSSYQAQNTRVPLAIEGNGYIDGWRFNRNSIRYIENFPPPVDMKAEVDNYIELGDVQTLTRTRYSTVHQFYAYNDPNNQPWTTGLINAPYGFIMGVKKL